MLEHEVPCGVERARDGAEDDRVLTQLTRGDARPERGELGAAALERRARGVDVAADAAREAAPLALGKAVVSSVATPQLLPAEQPTTPRQVPPSHGYRLTREGRIPVVKLERYYRYRLDALERLELGEPDAPTKAA